ncbi:putative udp-rhamnose:rhamnosyltransferase 1, partial [Quercus suber]
ANLGFAYISRREEKLSTPTPRLNSMAEPNKTLHIAMFPWLAFGHIIPFLELSKLIAQKGHRISFISTPRNIERLPKIPPQVAPLITLVKLPLPHVENLPENAEATMDVPYHIIPYLKKAHDGLEQPLSHFLETSTPDWVIHDFAPHWLPPIASKLGISRAYFSIFNASTLCFLGPTKSSVIEAHEPRSEPNHFVVPPKWVPFHTKVAFRYFEAKQIFDLFEENDSGNSDWFRYMKALSGVDALVIKTCVEVEGEWVKLLGELHDTPVIPVGLLPPSKQESLDNKDSNWDTIVEWLNKQEKASVVYIALGSEIQPSQNDFNELAFGLEQSGNEQDGSFTRDSITETLKLVMQDEKGKIYRDKAKEMATIFGDRDIHNRCNSGKDVMSTI